MRRFGIAVLLAFLMPPIAAAHGDGIEHVNPYTFTLPPDQSAEAPIEFEEGPLREDWIFILNAVADGSNPLDVELLDNDSAVANWTLPADNETHYLSGRIPATDIYRLRVHNPGEGPVRVTFYYDASCNCAGKPIPPQVPQGLVVFQVDPEEGDQMRTLIPEPKALKLRVDHAVRTDEASRWPQDFQILGTSTQAHTEARVQAHTFEWTAKSAERHYFLATAVETNMTYFESLPEDEAILSVYISPHSEKVGGASPVPVWPTLLAFGVAALWLPRRPGRSTQAIPEHGTLHGNP